MPRVLVVAAADGADATRRAIALDGRTDPTGETIRSAVWVGEEGSPGYEQFAVELAKRAGR